MKKWISETPQAVRILICVMSLLSFAVSFSSNPISVILVEKGLEKDMHWIIGVFSMSGVLFYLFGGYLTDRFDGRRIALYALPLMLIATLLTGLADTTAQFLPVRIIHGASYAMIFPPLYALLSEHLSSKEHLKHYVFSASSGAEFFAGGLGFAVGLWLLENGHLLLWNSIGPITVGIGFVLLLRVPSARSRNESKRQITIRSLLQGQRKVFRVTSIQIGIMIAHRVTISYLALYIGGIAGVVILLANCANVFFAPWVAMRAKRHGDYRLLRIATLTLAVTMAAIWVSPKLPFGIGVICLVCIGILQGTAMRINATCMLHLVDSEAHVDRKGSAMAVRSLTAEVSIMVGNIFGGWVAIHWGYELLQQFLWCCYPSFRWAGENSPKKCTDQNPLVGTLFIFAHLVRLTGLEPALLS